MTHPRHFTVATAGHVDHGKSSLVKALTGVDPDRLPEEKARQITIDLGFAQLELPLPSTSPGPEDRLSLGIVDVPGHEDFAANMVAGVGGIDLALLIISAEDGWMPQTEEHLQILTYLGITEAIVVLTKCDLVADLSSVQQGIATSLSGSAFAHARQIPTSVVTGHGLAELKAELIRLLGARPPAFDQEKPRLPVDRVFTLEGIGTVVTGTLIGGRLREGQEVVVQPAGVRTKIRSLQSHGLPTSVTAPGQRTAANLPIPRATRGDVTTVGAEGIRRGDVVTLESLGQPSRILEVELQRSPRLNRDHARGAEPLKQRARVWVHHGSTQVAARIDLLSTERLEAGARAVAKLHLESPLFCLMGDRFILRDWAQRATLAGGLVLVPAPARSRRKRGDQAHFLERLSQAPTSVEKVLRTYLDRDLALPRPGLLAQSQFTEPAIATAIAILTNPAAPTALERGGWLILKSWWDTLLQRSLAWIDQQMKLHPELPGAATLLLRQHLGQDLGPEALWPLFLTDLCRTDLRQEGSFIKRQSVRPTLPAELRPTEQRIRATLKQKPLDPPFRKDLAPDATSQKVLRFLIQTGEVTELNSDLVLLTEAYRRAAQAVRQHLVQQGQATVAELRDLLGTTRRTALPLLEKLDRERVTIRRDDVRIAGPKTV